MTDTSAQDDNAEAFLRLDRAAKQAGASIAGALAAGQGEGRKLDDVLKKVGQTLASMAVQSAGKGLLGTLASTLGSTLASTAGSVTDATGLAAPQALAGLDLVASAAPSPMMAAASAPPAPATRGAPVSITIQTPDAESFRRSEAQVTAAIARAVQRGQRGL